MRAVGDDSLDRDFTGGPKSVGHGRLRRRPMAQLSAPAARDGSAMWRLATDVGLDRNSPYKYLLFCRDFSGTSVVARHGDVLVAFVTGYRRPVSPETLFVWQVAVSTDWRRCGLGLATLDHLRNRLAGDGVRWLEASVTPSNHASRRLFLSFAEGTGASWAESELFDASAFPFPHESESLLRIGPLRATNRKDCPRCPRQACSNASSPMCGPTAGAGRSCSTWRGVADSTARPERRTSTSSAEPGRSTTATTTPPSNRRSSSTWRVMGSSTAWT